MSEGNYKDGPVSAVPDNALLGPVGTIIDLDIEILELLGSGGTSAVYRGRQIKVERQVAVKILHATSQSNPDRILRFQREAQLISGLTHPQIVTIYAFGVSENQKPYMVLELIDGPTLSQYLSTNGPLSPAVAIGIFRQICQALEAAHSAGIIHRDLKPGNVMFTQGADWGPDGPAIKVLDFGIARVVDTDTAAQKLTATGYLLGSPAYMSPEQCLGQELCARSDIYSLGCLMYECLSGQTPFSGETPLEVLYKQVHDRTRNTIQLSDGTALSPALANVVNKCLSKNPKHRYASAADVERALAAINLSEVKPHKRRFRWRLGLALATVFMAVLAWCTYAIVEHTSQSPAGVSSSQGRSVNAIYREALSLKRQGHTVRALEMMQTASTMVAQTGQSRSVERSDVLVEIADAYRVLRRPDLATRAISEALEAMPPALLQTNKGEHLLEVATAVYTHSGKRNAAMSWARKIMMQKVHRAKGSQDKCNAYIEYADTARQVGRCGEAQEYYQKAMQLLDKEGTWAPALWPRILFGQAAAAYDRGDGKKREHLLLEASSRVVAINDDSQTLGKTIDTELAEFYAHKHDYARSDIWIKRAIKDIDTEARGNHIHADDRNLLEENRCNVLQLAGLNALSLGKLETARKQFESSAAVAQKSATDNCESYLQAAYEGMTICAYLQGNKEATKTLWNNSYRHYKQATIHVHDCVILPMFVTHATNLLYARKRHQAIELMLFGLGLCRHRHMQPESLAGCSRIVRTIGGTGLKGTDFQRLDLENKALLAEASAYKTAAERLERAESAK